MKILVANDSKTNLSRIASVLIKLGHEVVSATSCQQTVMLFQEMTPDVVILDLTTNNDSNFDCTKQIRELDIKHKISFPTTILFFINSPDDELIGKMISVGVFDYLVKPISALMLTAKIKSLQDHIDVKQKLVATTQELSSISAIDSLTGISNRSQFDNSLKTFMLETDRKKTLLALMLIDLDNFKVVNDTFGHHIGDLLLVEVTQRLKSCLRSTDFIARSGADEFIVVLDQLESQERAAIVAQKIINIMASVYEIKGNNIRIGASVGISLYPTDDMTKKDLILNADIALDYAKKTGRNNYQFYSDDLKQQYQKRIHLEHELKFAIEKNQLFLTYQPIFNLETRKIIGVEVLLGWNHPVLGFVSPHVFIPVAERSGLIAELGDWVFQTVAHQIKDWNMEMLQNMKLALNISSRQLLHEEFYQSLVNLILTTGLAPNNLQLELTETAIMGYEDEQLQIIMRNLQEIGIGVSIDDVGTGYSSLIRLQHSPINTLKIEKAFVQEAILDNNSAVIVKCLISLGKNLGMAVIAEAIETEEQLTFLLDAKCPEGQGYYLAKPMNANQIAAYLEKSRTTV